MKKPWLAALAAVALLTVAVWAFQGVSPEGVPPVSSQAVQAPEADSGPQEEELAGKLTEIIQAAAEGRPEPGAQRELAGQFRLAAEASGDGKAALEAAELLEAMAEGKWLGWDAASAQADALAVLPGMAPGALTPELLARAQAGSCLAAVHRREQAQGMISITAAGDCTFGQYPEVPAGVGFEEEMARRDGDLTFPLAGSRPFFAADDITILNCEGTFTTREKMAQKKYRFKGDPSYGQIFALGSAEAVNLANNHTLDYFEEGREDTIAALDAAGVGSFGDGRVCWMEFPAGKAALLGYNTVDKGEPDLTAQLALDIGAAREAGADLVVVSFHWGYEYFNDPAPYQRQMGRTAIDLGADLVLGHHPHVIQGLEEYKGHTIVYSLGNYAFGGDEEIKDRDTFVFRQAFRLEEGVWVPAEPMVFPFYLSGRSDRNDYSPVPVFGEEARRIAGRLEELGSRIPGGGGLTSLSFLE